MKRFLLSLATIVLVAFLAACSSNKQSNQTTNAKKTDIYTSIYPLEYLAETIGGDHVNVTSVFPPGVDSHTYEPTTKEIGAISRADMFIYMGAGMEGFSEKVENTLADSDVTFVKISSNDRLFEETWNDGSPNHHGRHHRNHHGAPNHHGHHYDEFGADPHVWLDPLRMLEMANVVKDELISVDPDHKDDYIANFTGLEEKLKKLDLDFSNTLKDKKEGYFLVSHAAYTYWEERYHIIQIPIHGPFNNEPSQKELADITKFAEEHHIRHMIYEQSGPDRLGEIVQEHLDADALELHNLEIRTEKDIENNLDYIDLMEQNLAVLDKAIR